MTQIDYSSLAKPVTQSDVDEFNEQYYPGKKTDLSKKNIGPEKILLIVALIVSSVVLPIVSIVGRLDFFSLAMVVVFIAFFVLVTYGAMKYSKSVFMANVKTYRFAKANGLVFNMPSDGSIHNGVIFSVGQNRKTDIQLSNQVSGSQFEVANYSYVIESGSGDDRTSTTYHYGYIIVKLDRKLPHILLDSRTNGSLPASMDRNQVLSLEGDFDKYFTLYCPKGYEQDALYVFSPDLMQMFINETANYDAEIIDDQLFIYQNSSFNFTDPVSLQKIFRIIDTVGAETKHNTKHYEDMNSQAVNVEIAGSRLKSSVNPVVWVILGVFVLIFLFQILSVFNIW